MRKGEKMTPEQRLKQGDYRRGIKHTPETKAKMSASHMGHKTSKATRHKLSIAKLGDRNPTKRLDVREKIRTKRALQVITPKMRAALKLGRGKGSPNWKGGISKRKDYSPFMARKRYLLKTNAGTHTLVEWDALKKKHGYTCLCCKKPEPKISLTEDHIIPLSKDGSNDISNLQPLCQPCNSRKGTKTIDYRLSA